MTALEFIKLNAHKTDEDNLIEFAKIHVKKALEAADNNAQVEIVDWERTDEGGSFPVYGVDSDSILKSYPLNKIK